jgi:hypothetical protein
LAFSGKNVITGVNGPMGRSIDSLALWMKAMTTEECYEGRPDPYMKLYPFDLSAYTSYQDRSRKLRIGYFSRLDLI